MSTPLLPYEAMRLGSTWDEDSYNLVRLWLLNAFTVRNLRVANNSGTPNTKIDLSCDLARLHYVTGGTTYPAIAQGVSLTLDAATTGANGLDAGSLGTGELWHLFIIGKDPGESGVIAGADLALLASLSEAAPTMPAGYTHKRLLSWDWTDGASHFKRFHHDGTLWKFDEQQVVASGSAAAARTTADLSGFMPAFARQAFLRTLTLAGGGGDAAQYLYATMATNQATGTVDTDYGEEGQLGTWVPTPTQEVDYEVVLAGAANWYVYIEAVLAPIMSEGF